MTAYQYVEDLTKSPFAKTKKFYKKFRLCKNEDYERYGQKGYVDTVEQTVGFFPEHCLDDWKNLTLIAQNF